jgi:hypothetical protein
VKDIASSVAKTAPPLGANFWIWLTSHDINWLVALATLIYISLQVYVLVRDKLVNRRAEKDAEAAL